VVKFLSFRRNYSQPTVQHGNALAIRKVKCESREKTFAWGHVNPAPTHPKVSDSWGSPHSCLSESITNESAQDLTLKLENGDRSSPCVCPLSLRIFQVKLQNPLSRGGLNRSRNNHQPMARFCYNSLPPIEEASKTLNEVQGDYLYMLGQLLVKYGVQSRLGISLVHRHFRLEDDEQLIRLRVRQSDEVVSTVFKNGLPDSRIVKDYNLVTPKSSKLIPYMCIVRESGIVPYEYCCTEEEEADILYFNVLSRIDDDFLAEWTTILDRLQMVDKLGLAILEDNPVIRFEALCSDQRVTICKPGQVTTGSDESQYITTVWMASGSPLEKCSSCT
jgi:hypothetical protein